MDVILIPTFNDWDCVALLLRELDRAAADFESPVEILLIDDGSTDPMPDFDRLALHTLSAVSILHLRRNLGHQRAIAVGLVYVYANLPCQRVVVMDGDGEDQPSGIAALAARFDQERGQRIIFAARAKRLERWSFRALYHIYRLLHWMLTGDEVRVGNFSIIPFQSLAKLVVVPEIWNHYAAAVIRSRIAFASIPIARGRRLFGRSKMNFVGLLLHGLSAFFVYGDIVGARLLVAIALALTLEVLLVATGAAMWATTTFSVLTLSAYLAAFVGIILLQAVPVALILVFTVIGSRVNAGFLPVRDCAYFVSSLERVFPR